jgi:hypothetical protein
MASITRRQVIAMVDETLPAAPATPVTAAKDYQAPSSAKSMRCEHARSVATAQARHRKNQG